MAGPSSGKNATIVDVAREASVSIKTVSRVINGDPTVKKKNLERVEAAIKKTGYRRNLFARGLRAKKSMMIGLLYEQAQGDYPADILSGALSVCRERDYHLLVEIVDGREALESVRNFVMRMSFDGVVLTPPVCDNMEVIGFLRDHQIEFVRISPLESLPDGGEISIDDTRAAETMVDYLIAEGHRSIALIRGNEGHRATVQREAGYRRALQRAGLPINEDWVLQGGFSFEDGYRCAQILLSQTSAPTAIFASNDESAAGVLSCAHDRGVSVPDELAVCGFDGSRISQFVHPPLATIAQPTVQIGRAAVEMLVSDTAKSETPRRSSLTLPFELRRGASVSPSASRARGPVSVLTEG